MSVMRHVKKFPAVSLPVRKEIARAGHCPECGDTLNHRAICNQVACSYDAGSLLEYKQVITAAKLEEVNG